MLAALKQECVRAPSFWSAAWPMMPRPRRRILAEGHTVAHHSMTHPMTLAQLPVERARAISRPGSRRSTGRSTAPIPARRARRSSAIRASAIPTN
ncbi:hypothetical protein [Phreatobacter stygius]|uniref:hypothetical protein n=1 Tax=Phreatobacter stygius TaxID=1940610 RepID=UPI00319E6BD4